MSKESWVFSFLWNDPRAKHTPNYQFTPKHVNTLFKRLDEGRRNLPQPSNLRFGIITDHPVASDFDLDVVSYFPLWSDYRDIGRCFTRLGLFGKGVREKYLGIDPDAVVVSMDLDQVVIKPNEYLRAILRDREVPFTGYRDSKNPRCYSGALWKIDPTYGDMSFVHDTFNHVYEVTRKTRTTEAFFNGWNSGTLEFDPETKRMVNVGLVGSDQCWISTALGGSKTYPRIDNFDGVYDYWSIEDLPGGDLPSNAVAVFTNGMRRDVSMKDIQDKHWWIRDYWRDVV